jgi:hypothetical protein
LWATFWDRRANNTIFGLWFVTCDFFVIIGDTEQHSPQNIIKISVRHNMGYYDTHVMKPIHSELTSYSCYIIETLECNETTLRFTRIKITKRVHPHIHAFSRYVWQRKVQHIKIIKTPEYRIAFVRVHMLYKQLFKFLPLWLISEYSQVSIFSIYIGTQNLDRWSKLAKSSYTRNESTESSYNS